jgi:hypothetical protein
MSDGVRVALFFAALFAASAINTAFLPLLLVAAAVTRSCPRPPAAPRHAPSRRCACSATVRSVRLF